MNKKQLLVMVAMMLVVAMVSVAGTIAFLTSSTGPVENTFTVGKVEITLDETDVDLYGKKDGNTRVTKNSYKLIPGHTYTKDPTVHVADGSEECWVFVKVVDEISAIEDTKTIAAQMTEKGWTLVDGEANIYANSTKAKAGDDVVVFEYFTIKGDADVASYDGKTVVITAYAVQADTFTTADAAWKAAKANGDVTP